MGWSARADVRSSVIVGVAEEGVRLKSVKTAVVAVEIVPAPEARHSNAVAVKLRNLRAASRAWITPPNVRVRVRGTKTLEKIKDSSSWHTWISKDRRRRLRPAGSARAGRRHRARSTGSPHRPHSRRMPHALFGTDGIRGTAGVFPLDARTIQRVGAALVKVLPCGCKAAHWPRYSGIRRVD